MGCGASKPPEGPESATEKQSIYRALDVKPPPSASPPKPPAAAAELQRPTALQKQATVGNLSMTAAGRRKTDTTRRVAVSAETSADALDDSYVPTVVEKAEDVQAAIRAGLWSNPLFESLAPDLLQKIVDAMAIKEHTEGSMVIRQGDPGDNFYVVTEGSLAAYIATAGDEPIQEYRAGDTFGELALLHGCPRAASVKATTACVLWALDRRAFRALVTSHNLSSKHGIAQVLSQIPALRDPEVREEQIQALADAVTIEDYSDGEYIITMGSEADSLFIILSGEVVCHMGSGTEELMRQSAGSDSAFFGESCLTDAKVRGANVVAVGPCRCAQLRAEVFRSLLGTVPELISFNFNMKVLSKCELLSALDSSQLESLVEAMEERTYQPSEIIIEQDTIGTTFFIIKSGAVEVVKDGETVRELSKLDYFGERSLLTAEHTAATVRVPEGGEPCLVMTLDKEAFESRLGALQVLVDRERRRVEAKATAASKAIVWSDLQVHGTLGEGSFGKVKLVLHRPTKTTYALKCLRKGHVIKMQQTEHVVNEKRVMELCDHPFVLKLMAVYNSVDQIFMLLEIAQGGELFTLLRSHKRFEEPHACLYAAMVASAFAYLHARRVVHRDLKPENLLFDRDGYLKLVDFGFAKVVRDRTFTLCGTPEYLAPEIISNKGHGLGADWWTLGILLYEMLVGSPPFAADNQMDIYHKIMRGKYKVPSHFPRAAKEMVSRLLSFNPAARLGCLKSGSKEVLQHDFFRSIDWRKLTAKEVRVPYRPQIKDHLDTSNFVNFPSEDYSKWDRYNQPSLEPIWAKEFGEVTGLTG